MTDYINASVIKHSQDFEFHGRLLLQHALAVSNDKQQLKLLAFAYNQLSQV